MAASILGGKTSNGISYTGVVGPGGKWIGSVIEPVEFESNLGQYNESVGSWNFTQLIQPTRSIDQNGQELFWTLNDLDFQLDVAFPYMQNPDDLYNNSGSTGWKAYSNSVTHTSNDSPFLTLADSNNVYYQGGHMHDKFKVYLMYRPPNTNNVDVEWVPLQYLEWHTDGDSTSADISYDRYPVDANPAHDVFSIHNHQLSANSSGVSRPIVPTVIAKHPVWQKIVSPGGENDRYK